MFSLPGAAALSQFRLDRLVAQLRNIDARVTAVASRWLHLVDPMRVPDARETQLLERLLGEVPPLAPSSAGQTLIVTPRIGTVSPWSSKATDIARVCGLDFVHRLERGCIYSIAAGAQLDEATLRLLGSVLHDRMTES